MYVAVDAVFVSTSIVLLVQLYVVVSASFLLLVCHLVQLYLLHHHDALLGDLILVVHSGCVHLTVPGHCHLSQMLVLSTALPTLM